MAIHGAVTLNANTFLVEDAIALETSTAVTGPYVAVPDANVNQKDQTITASLTGPTCFYVLRSSTALTITGIRILVDRVVINYDY